MLDTITLLAEAANTYLTIRIGNLYFAPQYTALLVTAIAAALLSALKLWRIGRQEDRQVRLDALRAAVTDTPSSMQPERWLWYHALGRAIAMSPVVGKSEQQRLLDALAAAGIRGHGQLAILLTVKVCGAIILATLCWFIIEWRHLLGGSMLVKGTAALAGLILGWRLPDFGLSRMAARRRLKVEQSLPDALDLLVICAEAGLSLDQGIEQTAKELATASPEVAEELAVTAAEMRVLSDRAQALQNLVTRTQLPSLHGIAATLVQAIRFGTPLAESMRVIAAELRSTRLARIEERAARLPVLLAIPLMAFVLPALFMVIGTPIAMRVFDFLGNLRLPNSIAP
jgi:tight adherence protein C